MSVKNHMTALADAVRSKSGATGNLSIDKNTVLSYNVAEKKGGAI